MRPLLARGLYRLAGVSSETEAELVQKESGLLVKVPIESGVGYMVISLDLEEVQEYLTKVPDLHQAPFGQELFGRYHMSTSGKPSMCLNCGMIGTSHESNVEYEARFLGRYPMMANLCMDCEEDIRQTVIGLIIENCPDLVISTYI